MRLPTDTHDKMMSAYHLLDQDVLNINSFEHIRVLLKGLHPEIDKNLEKAAKALAVLEKLQEGDVITLSAEHLPEATDKQKKRKKALLFFITHIKDLQNEIKRVSTEMSQSNGSANDTAWHAGKIIKYAKGPLGIITIAAVIIVIIVPFINKPSSQNKIASPTIVPSGKSVQVITYNGKKIPLSQFFVGHGPDCDSPHYHAPGEKTVAALDGTVLQDPGGCGFGKVKDMQVTTVSQ